VTKHFDLDSAVKVGVTDIVGKARGPRSRKEKLAERRDVETQPSTELEEIVVQKKQVRPEPKPTVQVPVHREHSVNAHENSVSAQPPSMSTPMSAHLERSLSTQNAGSSAGGLLVHAKEKKVALQVRHIKILQFLKNNLVTENATRLIYHKQISDVTGIPFASVRRYMSELKSLGVIISSRKSWSNGYQGNYYHLNLVKCRECLGLLESMRYMSAEFNEPQATQRLSERSMPAQTEYSLNTNSSSSSFKKNITTTEATPYDLNNLDVEEFHGLDVESLVRFRANYATLEAFQNFIDKVAYVVGKSRGTSSELRNPNAFLIKSLERRYVNVDSEYKSRALRREEEELASRQAELDAMKRIRDERHQVEAAQAKLKFESWVESESRRRSEEFEKERTRTFPVGKGSFDVPPSIRARQLLEVQVDTFLIETGLPLTLRGALIRQE
jgi:hypothetical protein